MFRKNYETKNKRIVFGIIEQMASFWFRTFWNGATQRWILQPSIGGIWLLPDGQIIEAEQNEAPPHDAAI